MSFGGSATPDIETSSLANPFPEVKNPDTGEPEGAFRANVRNILGCSWDTRDEAILEKLRTLVRHAHT